MKSGVEFVQSTKVSIMASIRREEAHPGGNWASRGAANPKSMTYTRDCHECLACEISGFTTENVSIFH